MLILQCTIATSYFLKQSIADQPGNFVLSEWAYKWACTSTSLTLRISGADSSWQWSFISGIKSWSNIWWHHLGTVKKFCSIGPYRWEPTSEPWSTHIWLTQMSWIHSRSEFTLPNSLFQILLEFLYFLSASTETNLWEEALLESGGLQWDFNQQHFD